MDTKPHDGLAGLRRSVKLGGAIIVAISAALGSVA
jgi:hypothetical protein